MEIGPRRLAIVFADHLIADLSGEMARRAVAYATLVDRCKAQNPRPAGRYRHQSGGGVSPGDRQQRRLRPGKESLALKRFALNLNERAGAPPRGRRG